MIEIANFIRGRNEFIDTLHGVPGTFNDFHRSKSANKLSSLKSSKNESEVSAKKIDAALINGAANASIEAPSKMLEILYLLGFFIPSSLHIMIQIQENISLQYLNTFGIDAKARYFIEASSDEVLQELFHHTIFRNTKYLILGGGSNILFTKDFDGLVIKSAMTGIKVTAENNGFNFVRAGSGENWHSLVMHCLRHEWGGLENLSLIPGTVGAAPIQNIGAYGVEIQNVIENVSGIELSTGTLRTFSNSDCHFNYRESIFKQELKEKYFISSITLRLTKKKHHLNTSYGAIQDVLKQHNITHPTIQNVSDAVIAIRKSKLPDPRVIGNAGSFFKNPTVRENDIELIKKEYPSIPIYPIDNQNVKVAAGWLIEQCGWKGKKFGNIGVHPQQALVLVNYGNGNGEEIFQLAMKIQTSVKEKFGITLTTEVNII